MVVTVEAGKIAELKGCADRAAATHYAAKPPFCRWSEHTGSSRHRRRTNLTRTSERPGP
jgi:hypothetical protein